MNATNILKNKKRKEKKADQQPQKSLAVLTYQAFLCILSPWHLFLCFFFKMSELQQKTFPFPLGWSESSSSSSRFQSSALQIRAHRRAALSMNEEEPQSDSGVP